VDDSDAPSVSASKLSNCTGRSRKSLTDGISPSLDEERDNRCVEPWSDAAGARGRRPELAAGTRVELTVLAS